MKEEGLEGQDDEESEREGNQTGTDAQGKASRDAGPQARIPKAVQFILAQFTEMAEGSRLYGKASAGYSPPLVIRASMRRGG